MPIIRLGEYEESLFARGFSVLVGADEAGRGPFAGPIVGAAVAITAADMAYLQELKVRDSKKITEKRREELYDLLTEYFVGRYVVTIKTAREIDERGLQWANLAVLSESVESLTVPIDHILVDGFHINTIRTSTERVIKGDAKMISIAAASILAKVTRDRMMRELDLIYPQYGFAEHKGYGTATHKEAIRQHGLCPEHRRSFTITL